MLEELRIRGLGVIDDAELHFGPGLTVITGETGAGKTMVLTGLGLVLGGRADAARVRTGATQAVVDSRWSSTDEGALTAAVEAAGGLLDEGTVLIGRTLSAEGRSRASLAGRAVPAGVLAELADALVAVHGQSDQQRLLRPSAQREALDRYAGESALSVLERYRSLYKEVADIHTQVLEVERDQANRAALAAGLRLGLEAIEKVSPAVGEDDELAIIAARLGHAEQLRTGVAAAHQALVGSEEGGYDQTQALTSLMLTRRELDAAAELDPTLIEHAKRAGELSVLTLDLAADLADYQTQVESDPLRLQSVQERRAELAQLTRAHGGSIEATLAWAKQSAQQLFEIEDDGPRLARLQQRLGELRQQLGECAGDLSHVRTAAAATFAAAVTDELAHLSMGAARLVVAVEQRSEPGGLTVGGRELAFGLHGVDDVDFRLVAHVEATELPLARGASGGELSRVMLAVEVVLAGADPVDTMIFDEVDAGVGGAAAVEVGRRLSRLARTAQVIVVTHLPQVAAFADHHLCVVKDVAGNVTTSGITRLTQEGRVGELARMLAGNQDSSTAQAHARELLDSVNA